MFTYRAHCVEIIDGDTQDVVVDLGFHIQRRIRLRLQGVDTHETFGVSHDSAEYQQGKRETEFVREWLQRAKGVEGEWPLVVRTEKTGKYGRYLAEVERRTDGETLNDALRREFDGVEA